MGRTESLGLKCLAERPLLVNQFSTDSVFSHVEGETMEPPDDDDDGNDSVKTPFF